MRRRWPWLLAAALVLLLAAWGWGSPYWTVRTLEQAAQAGDVATLSAHIDYPAVRASLKDQVQARITSSRGEAALGPIGSLVARELADPIVDAVVTPAGMRAVFASGTVSAQGEAPRIRLDGDAMRLRREAPGRFALGNADGTGGQLVFRLRGVRWMLTEIRLTDDLRF